MRIALCTTTIHIPHALKLMRKCSPDKFSSVKFFVAGDEKSPHEDIEAMCEATDSGKNWDVVSQSFKHEDAYMREHFGNSEYYDVERQIALGYKCSKSLGWNTLARRNIAFLEALKWGADVIYSWDNDNIPINVDHFGIIDNTFEYSFDGIKVSGADVWSAKPWFDPGSLLIPRTRHRGFPHDYERKTNVHPVTDAKIGVAAGLVIGDPDIDAVTRMEHRPDIGQVHLLGQTGVVVDPDTWTIFNTQNTAVVRELVPAWFLMPNVGRHDDIYASLIVQRVGRERGYHVHLGPPFTFQARNPHNLIADLRKEIDGMEGVEKLADLLDQIQLPGRTVLEDVRLIYGTLLQCDFLPKTSVEAGLEWLEDVEGVL